MEIQDHQETQDLLEDLENVVKLAVMGLLEPLDLMVSVDNKVCQEALETQELQDQKDNKEIVERSVNEV